MPTLFDSNISATGYDNLSESLANLMSGEENFVSNMANASALLRMQLPEVDWVGFYLWDAERRILQLGPFQGLPACPRIPWGKGLCGQALMQGTTVIMNGSDGANGFGFGRSEIALPLQQGRTIIGVLSIDSPAIGRFSNYDREQLEDFVKRLVHHHAL